MVPSASVPVLPGLSSEVPRRFSTSERRRASFCVGTRCLNLEDMGSNTSGLNISKKDYAFVILKFTFLYL